MTETRLKISPPWITYLNELQALFREDPEITIKYDNDEKQVKLYIRNAEKAGALDVLLPTARTFGNVVLYITVVPENAYEDVSEASVKELFDMAFEDNPAYAFSKEVHGMWSFNCTYVVFKNKVVQFFNDNLLDIYGNVSTLYQEVASDVFAHNGFLGVAYCTDLGNRLNKPLGEWP